MNSTHAPALSSLTLSVEQVEGFKGRAAALGQQTAVGIIQTETVCQAPAPELR